MLTDFHCHLQSDCFKEDLPEVLFRAKKQCVDRFICNSVDIKDWIYTKKTAKQFKGTIIPCFGVHPLYVEERYSHMIPKLLPLLLLQSDEEHQIKTPIGEIGLDRHVEERDDALQELDFRTQLQIAKTQNRVVMLHTRKALDRVVEILSEEGPFPAVLFHGFSGPIGQMKKMVDLGGFFSFSANLLKVNHKKILEAAMQVPLDRVLLESDAPDLPPPMEMIPEDWRLPNGDFKRNPPPFSQILKNLAKTRGIMVDDIIKQIERRELLEEDWPQPTSHPIRNEPAIITQILHKFAEIREIPPNDLKIQIQANEQKFMRHIS